MGGSGGGDLRSIRVVGAGAVHGARLRRGHVVASDCDPQLHSSSTGQVALCSHSALAFWGRILMRLATLWFPLAPLPVPTGTTDGPSGTASGPTGSADGPSGTATGPKERGRLRTRLRTGAFSKGDWALHTGDSDHWGRLAEPTGRQGWQLAGASGTTRGRLAGGRAATWCGEAPGPGPTRRSEWELATTACAATSSAVPSYMCRMRVSFIFCLRNDDQRDAPARHNPT